MITSRIWRYEPDIGLRKEEREDKLHRQQKEWKSEGEISKRLLLLGTDVPHFYSSFPAEQDVKDSQNEQTSGTQTKEQTGAKTQAAGSLSSLLGHHLSSHLHLVHKLQLNLSATSLPPPPLSQSIICSCCSLPVGLRVSLWAREAVLQPNGYVISISIYPFIRTGGSDYLIGCHLLIRGTNNSHSCSHTSGTALGAILGWVFYLRILNISTCRTEHWRTDVPITGRLTLPPEPQLSVYYQLQWQFINWSLQLVSLL